MVGRLTIDRIDPHGSLGGAVVAAAAGEAEGVGVVVWASAAVETPAAQANDTAAMSRAGLIIERLLA